MRQEYIIYSDESEDRGALFSNFYGGVLIRSQVIDTVRATLAEKKVALNFHGEVKWQKITQNYRDKYIELLDTFFDLVEADCIKVRIMFTQNMIEPMGLTPQHHDDRYYLLYYQFIKHAFGLAYSPRIPGGVNIRVYPDKIPDTAERLHQFRGFITALGSSLDFRNLGIHISADDVADVHSHDHDVLQCLDIVLGAVQFRLNNKHREKPEGAARRGKRTLAKERVYKHINKRIRAIYPGFNIGLSTGTRGNRSNRWNDPYRHWRFMPNERRINGEE